MFASHPILIIVILVVVLLIWLLYRINRSIKFSVKNEIYDNFPTIKHSINHLDHRLEFLKTQIESVEQKLKEIESRAGKL